MAMDHKRVHEILKDEFETAKRQMNFASQRFNEVVRDIPSGLPQPDGNLRIQNAARALAAARSDVMQAHSRLNEFVARRVVPGDFEPGGPD